LRGLLASLDGLRRTASLALNLLDNGTDILLQTDAPLTTEDRTRCATFAAGHAVARIAWSDARLSESGRLSETVAQLRPPEIRFPSAGDATTLVRPPPGAFLQASQEGEAAIRAAVLAGLPPMTKRSRIVELYAGSGTLTFALAAHARVQAYEGAADAADALRRAAGGHRIDVITRDLARQPVMAADLKTAACMVLDPPFAGAGPQLAAIAAARVPRLIYVSCNPAILARDLRTLTAAGYRLLSAVAIDQFLWSARLESVIVMEIK
jgi:23S rRNA (uracil1939-C5)-methyltransferase